MRQEVLSRKRPKEKRHARNAQPKPRLRSPPAHLKMDATQAFRATAQNGSAQVNEAFEKMSAATAEATRLIKDSCSTAVKGAQDYNTKFIEFAQNNTKAAFDFVQKLSGVKSPSNFIELSTDHSRKQFETLTEQTKELAALAQKVTLATVEPLKTGVTRAFGQVALELIPAPNFSVIRSPGWCPGFLLNQCPLSGVKRTHNCAARDAP